MSQISNSKAAHCRAYTVTHPKLWDYIVYRIILASGDGEGGEKYLEGAGWNELSAQLRRDTEARAKYFDGMLTYPNDYFNAIDIKDYETRPFDLDKLTYFIKLKKELKPYLNASGMDDMARLMLNGRIDQYLSSKYPGYTAKTRA